jgi:hypothetical protein
MARRSDSAPLRGRRLQSWLFALAVVAITAATVVATFALRQQERDDADERSRAASEGAERALTSFVDLAIGATGGSSVVVGPDGMVDVGAFEVFASDLTGGSPAQSIALLQLVEAAERDAIEQAFGPIYVTTYGEPKERAPAAPRYLPVIAVQGTASRFTVDGADYLADPVRGPVAARAIDEGVTLMTRPTQLLGSGDPAVIVLHPLTSRDGEVVGVVASSLLLETIAADLLAVLPPFTEVLVADGDDVIASRGTPDGAGSRTTQVELAGRTWRVVVEPPPPLSPPLSSLVLGAGIAALFGVLVLMVVTLRHQRRVDRAYREVADAVRRSQTMERLADRLSRSLAGTDVADAVLESLPVLTGATGGAVSIVVDDRWLELLSASGYRDATPPARVRPPAGSILGEVVRSGETVYLSSPLAWRDDPLMPAFADIGMAAAVVPLVAEDTCLGVLVVSQPGVRRFRPQERSLLDTLGVMAGSALARSLRYDVEHATSVAFQRASLPASLPSTPGMAVAARYVPAADTAAVGGDWYDVIAITDGRVAVVVGDVVGHGIEAAAAMGHVRSAVRVLAGGLPEPDQLMRTLLPEVNSIRGALGATMAYGLVDPVTRRFHFVLAGHPPPLVVPAAGAAAFLPCDPWPPLGVQPATEPGPGSTTLEPGDLVVLYTDGVIERRGEDLSVGLERLRSAAEDLRDLDPDDLCDALVAALTPDVQPDDVALVAIRLDPSDRPVVPVGEGAS